MLHAKFQDHRTSGSGEDFWLAAKAASHILGPFSDTESYF